MTSGSIREFRSWNIEEYLPAIRCPILCIQGEEDEYGTIAQVKAIQARVPGTEIVMLPNCKHSPHRDQPEATLERMAEFVAGVQEEVVRNQGLGVRGKCWLVRRERRDRTSFGVDFALLQVPVPRVCPKLRTLPQEPKDGVSRRDEGA